MKGLIKKNTIKINVISTFNDMHEKYSKNYEEMAAKILESTEIQIFMDINEKKRVLGKTLSFEENVRGRASRASK